MASDSHPFKRGDKLVCVSATEQGIPIQEGAIYTVNKAFRGNQSLHEAVVPGMENTPGVSLIEVGGYFRADRFELDGRDE